MTQTINLFDPDTGNTLENVPVNQPGKKVNTDAYLEFVNAVTSQPSKDADAFEYRIQELRGEGFETWRLLTAAVGMSAEAGEFTEVVKKIIFQGKPVNEENLFHLKRELGDIMWYVAQACICLLYTSPSPRD